MRQSEAGARQKNRHVLAEEIVGRLVRRHSTAVVLFHHAIAERIGLGPTDHKCFDLLRERGSMTGTELAAITDLTSGAITGVVARLERAGYLRRELDSKDGRKQTLYPVLDRLQEFQDIFGPIRKDMAALLEGFDRHQLAAIAEFLARGTELAYHHVGLLRSQTLSTVGSSPGIANATVAKSTRKKSDRTPRR